jgi:hypothetical protein
MNFIQLVQFEVLLYGFYMKKTNFLVLKIAKALDKFNNFNSVRTQLNYTYLVNKTNNDKVHHFVNIKESLFFIYLLYLIMIL